MNGNKQCILGLHLCLTKIIKKNNCEQLVLKMSGCYPSIYLSSFSLHDALENHVLTPPIS